MFAKNRKRWVVFTLRGNSRSFEHDVVERVRGPCSGGWDTNHYDGEAFASITAYHVTPLKYRQELGQPFQSRTAHEVAAAPLEDGHHQTDAKTVSWWICDGHVARMGRMRTIKKTASFLLASITVFGALMVLLRMSRACSIDSFGAQLVVGVRLTAPVADVP